MEEDLSKIHQDIERFLRRKPRGVGKKKVKARDLPVASEEELLKELEGDAVMNSDTKEALVIATRALIRARLAILYAIAVLDELVMWQIALRDMPLKDVWPLYQKESLKMKNRVYRRAHRVLGELYHVKLKEI